ncbi:MAG: copper resistance protein NlpE [Gammaproteobacteria bacterium]
MQLSRQRSRTLLLSFLIFSTIFSVYAPVLAEETDTKSHDGHPAQHSLDWPGIYLGFLPCDDCIGTKMTLALNKRGTYVLITQYVGKSPREYVEKGTFSPGDKENTLVLTPRKSGTAHQYLVGKDMLIRLDDNGNRVSGEQADRYILRRNDVTDSDSSTSHGH